jgi:tRNA modification GTPase
VTKPAPPPDTIAAIATPAGRGGVGIVRVSGADLSAIVDGVVGRTLSPRVATLVEFRDRNGAAIDTGIALYFPAPNSYTGESVLELQGHGGPTVQRLTLARCLALGARIAEPGEFTKRAFLNGKLDLAQAEGVADLIEAATTTAARAAARSMTGEFSRDVESIVAGLTELRMYTEATLDFPEEDVAMLRAADAGGRLDAMRERLARLRARARAGAILREGLTVVLIGRPNVGKSSLLNRLVREDAAIVTSIPGTTRDTIERQVELAGIPLTIVDTAGLRESGDEVERQGMARTWAAVDRADVALVLADARDAKGALEPGDAALIARLPAALPRLVVHNKSDLASVDPHVEVRPANDATPRTHVWLSALTGDGIALLEHEVRALARVPDLADDTYMARARHLAALDLAAEHLDQAAGQIAHAAPPLELFAEELRLAQNALGEITGRLTADDLLGVIFSRFCIGK